jgi:hypothetical protein
MAWEMRDDDPPFRENFSTQPKYEPLVTYGKAPRRRLVEFDLQMIDAVEAVSPTIDEDADMIALSDVIKAVIEESKGMPYVKVNKLIARLRND